MKTLNPRGIEAEVTAELERQIGTSTPITEGSALWHDLRIGGDDAWELLREIAERYKVTFQNFRFSDYFPDEAEIGPLWRLAEWIGYSETKRRRFTVSHLLAVIEGGQWFEPED